MKTMILVAAFATLATAAVAGGPQSGSWKVGSDTYHIHYADLDLNSRAGRGTLLDRAERAAARLCHAPTRQEERQCVTDTLARVALPALAQARLERDGGALLAAR
jgi:UrcA family protein